MWVLEILKLTNKFDGGLLLHISNFFFCFNCFPDAVNMEQMNDDGEHVHTENAMKRCLSSFPQFDNDDDENIVFRMTKKHKHAANEQTGENQSPPNTAGNELLHNVTGQRAEPLLLQQLIQMEQTGMMYVLLM